jgi:hypothetical protein
MVPKIISSVHPRMAPLSIRTQGVNAPLILKNIVVPPPLCGGWKSTEIGLGAAPFPPQEREPHCAVVSHYGPGHQRTNREPAEPGAGRVETVLDPRKMDEILALQRELAAVQEQDTVHRLSDR